MTEENDNSAFDLVSHFLEESNDENHLIVVKPEVIIDKIQEIQREHKQRIANSLYFLRQLRPCLKCEPKIEALEAPNRHHDATVSLSYMFGKDPKIKVDGYLTTREDPMVMHFIRKKCSEHYVPSEENLKKGTISMLFDDCPRFQYWSHSKHILIEDIEEIEGISQMKRFIIQKHNEATTKHSQLEEETDIMIKKYDELIFTILSSVVK